MTIESTEAEQLDDSDILVHLTEWRTQVSEAPRSRGETYSVRFSVVALPNCWTITLYRKGSAYGHEVFASSFSDLCCFFKSIAAIGIYDGICLCVKALHEKTGITPPPLVKSDSSVQELIAYAQRVDDVYATDFAYHADVRSRIFKSSDGE